MLNLEFVDQSQASFLILDNTFHIGSSSKNQMVILRDHILDVHANVTAYHDMVMIQPAVPESQGNVNNSPIKASTPIHVGGLISLAVRN